MSPQDTRCVDMLENKWHDMTTPVVQCLICKTVSETWQIRDKRQDKNWNFV